MLRPKRIEAIDPLCTHLEVLGLADRQREMARPRAPKRCEEIEPEGVAPFFIADVVAAEFAVEVRRKSY